MPGSVGCVRPRDPHPGHRAVSGGLARAAVFGVNDGLVSNVSLLLGFAASGVDTSVVRLAGIAGAVAGAISMAAGEWISISAQNDLIERELDVERRELKHNPEFETAELAAMYESHGMDAGRAARAAAEVMREPATALVVHAREELGIDPDDLPSAIGAASLSLVCFLFGAVLPLIPWFVGSGRRGNVGVDHHRGARRCRRRGARRQVRRATAVADHHPPGRDRARRVRDHLRDR